MKHVARSTIIVALFFGLEKGLGFLRQVAIARTFGLSSELDAFNAANNYPDLLFALISGGALAMALIPVLSDTLETEGREAAWGLFSRIGNLLFLVTAGLSLLLAVFARPIVTGRFGVVPNFSPEQQELVIRLMRLDLIATFLFSLSGLVIAGLQANQHFFLPALAPSMYDVGTLIGVFILVPEKGYSLGGITLPAFGMGIYGLVYGTILGAALFLGVQIPGLVRYRFRWTPRIELANPRVQQVIRLMLPRIGTVFFIHVVFLAQDNLASGLPVGAVSALVYGWLFMQVPESLIGTAIGTVLLPTLSEQAALDDSEAYRDSLHTTVRALLALTLPATALLIVGIRPLIEVLGFDAAASDLVTWTARAYMLGLVGHSLLEVGVRAFYARQNAIVPLYASALTAVTFILFGLMLTPRLGAPGIALANILAFSGEAALLLYLTGRDYPFWQGLQKPLLRLSAVALGGGGVTFVLARLVRALSLPSLWHILASTAALGLSALLVLPFIWPEVKILGRIDTPSLAADNQR
ncbi:MAG: murein biosynthesis integral membrane protein MurJ [Anaerolineae bacterium]|nr:MAG: murein biosynthesis integral membrane protein MurJ [Anaerolineae bacterium]